MATGQLTFSFLVVVILLWITKCFIRYHRYERTRKQLGCAPLPQYPGWDRILGTGYVRSMIRALKENRFLEFQRDTYASFQSNVWQANFMGNRMVYSSKSENMKAMSTSHRDSFAVEPIRVANGAITPFTGRGVSSSDGAKWLMSRDLVKPYFERSGFTNLGRLEGHVDRLLSKIPTDGSTVDMQPLFQRWVWTL